MYGGQGRCIRGFYGEHGGKRLVRRPRRRWEGNNRRGGVGAWTGLIRLRMGTVGLLFGWLVSLLSLFFS